ncbi:MAG TPA: helix-turn-helix domain-containing protein [Acidimicrobiales bacterium]|nr:helix-turn-helix domain-containing protein [Acidimicrobiales bacterium]
MSEPIVWLSTKECCARLGVTVRTLYRFIDEGQLVAYQMGRVIRVQERDLQNFVESVRIAPGSLAHLYPDTGAADGLGTNGNGVHDFEAESVEQR